MQYTKVVALGVVENEGKILISQRNEPDVPDAHLKWDLLGGKNEFGESLEDTVKREVLEEAGITIEVLGMLPESVSRVWNKGSDEMHTLVFGFRCKLVSGSAEPLESKITQVKWVAKEELSDYDFIASARKFIDFEMAQ